MTSMADHPVLPDIGLIKVIGGNDQVINHSTRLGYTGVSLALLLAKDLVCEANTSVSLQDMIY